MAWDAERLTGPDEEDWRVPVAELEERRSRLSSALAETGFESALIDDPVELYWLTGGRQNGMILIGADGSDVENTHWVRKSLQRAKFESGDDDAPDLPAAITTRSQSIGHRLILMRPPNPAARLTSSAAAAISNSLRPSPPTSRTASNISLLIRPLSRSISSSQADFVSRKPYIR